MLEKEPWADDLCRVRGRVVVGEVREGSVGHTKNVPLREEASGESRAERQSYRFTFKAPPGCHMKQTEGEQR